MRIALLTTSPLPDRRCVGRYFALAGLETLFAKDDNELRRFRPPLSPSDFAQLAECNLALVVGFEQHATRAEMEGLHQLDCPIITIGFSASEMTELNPCLPSLRALSGTFGVAEASSQQRLTEEWGPHFSDLVHCPSLFIQDAPIPEASRRPVITLATGDPSLTDHARSVFLSLAPHAPLFLADSPEALAKSPSPGDQTLFVPSYPRLHLRALASASYVLAFDPQTVPVAVALDIPCVAIGESAAAEWMARSLGVPFLHAGESDNGSLLARARECLSHYPTEAIQERRSYWQQKLLGHLRDRGAPLIAPPRQKRVAVVDRPLTVALIADERYQGPLLAFWKNLVETYGHSIRLHLLAIDDKTREFALRNIDAKDLTIYSLSDLWVGGELAEILSRPIVHQAYASKARLLRRALENEMGPVFYFDLDIFFFRSPFELLAEMGEASILLFPNWADYLEETRRYGIFNAGMIGVGRGGENFLDWWAQLCLFEYEQDDGDGYYVDQGFLDMVPIYFDGVKVLRTCEHNIARWNMHSTVETFHPTLGWQPKLRGGNRIVSFHAAFTDSLGLFEAKFGWDQLVAIFSEGLSPAARLTIYQQCIEQQKLHWRDLSRLELGRRYVRQFARFDWEPGSGAWNVMLHGWGRYFLSVAARMHALVRRLQGAGRPMVRPDKGRYSSIWIQLQRSVLFRKRAERRGTPPRAHLPSAPPPQLLQ